jgi:hypothetical protein
MCPVSKALLLCHNLLLCHARNSYNQPLHHLLLHCHDLLPPAQCCPLIVKAVGIGTADA